MKKSPLLIISVFLGSLFSLSAGVSATPLSQSQMDAVFLSGESDFSNGRPSFEQGSGCAKSILPNYFKLKLQGMNFSDETVVRFNSLATTGFDGNYDAFKLFSSNQQAANISSLSMGNDYMVNTLPIQNLNISVPVRAKIGTSGSYTIFFQQIDSMDASVCLIFQDLITGVQLDMRQQASYSFSANDTSWWPRFRVKISGALSYTLSDEGCPGDNNGSVVLSNPAGLAWNFTLQEPGGNVVGTQSGSSQNFVFNQLSPGHYLLVASGGNGCPVPVDTLFIPPGNAVSSAFSVDEDTVFLSAGATVQFTSAQTGSLNWLWDFGDGTTNDSTLNPQHTYALPGQYQVTLTSVNGGCIDSSSTMITVLGIVSLPETQVSASFYFASGEALLYYSLPGTDTGLLQVYDMNGKRVSPTMSLGKPNGSIRLPVQGLSAGMYCCILEYRGVSYRLKFILP
jgi:hypothetical protein